MKASRLERWLAGPVGPRPIAVVLGQAALMLENGIPPGEAFSILAGQQDHPVLSEALIDVDDRISRHGWSLSQALASYPALFPSAVVTLCRAGETGGDLAGRLRKAGQLLERTSQIQAQVKQALTGPAITVGVASVIVLGVVKFVMPRFLGLYEQMQVPLPLLSRLVIGGVQLVDQPLAPLLALGLLFGLYRRRRSLQEWAFGVAIRVPVLRYWVGTVLCAQLCEILGSLHREGIPLHVALQTLARTARYPVYRKSLENICARLISEGSLADSMALVPYFPPLVVSFCQIGEETGSLDDLLAALSRLLSQQTESVVDQLVTLVEPLVICGLGLVLAVLFVGMFLPVYGLLSRLGG